MKDLLIDETKEREALSRLQHIKMQIKKEKIIGRRGGASRWPVHIVLLICEMLVNGTPPTAVPANLQSTQAAFTGVKARELPSVNFVRQCRLKICGYSHWRCTIHKHFKTQIKKEKIIGRKGGASRWPVHIVLLICDT